MMTQSVMTQAVNLFGSAAVSATPKGKPTGNGFDLMIDSNLKSVQNDSSNKEITSAERTGVQNSNTSRSDRTTRVEGEKETELTTDKTKQTASKQTDDTKATKDEKGKVTTEEEPTADEKIMAQLAGLFQSIRETIMEALNLTSEELNQLLTDQGMSEVDLLQSDKLQQLVLAGNGETDILAVLTDQNLSDTMKQLLQAVEEIKSDANLQLTDVQIKSILEQAKLQSEMQPQAQEIIKTPEDSFVGQQQADLQSEVNTGVATAEEDDKITSNLNSQKDALVETSTMTDVKEINSGAQSDTEKEKNSDLKSSEQFQVFVDNLVKSQNTQLDFTGNLAQVTELRDIANQIIERIKISIQPDQTSMELQLNPENLGKVNLSIQSKNGVMTAQFVVQNEMSKEAIESQLHTLRETLNEQGIKVEAIEVTVSTYAFEQNSQEGADNQADTNKNSTGKKISLDDALNMTDLSEEEANAEDITGTLGSQIDYTA